MSQDMMKGRHESFPWFTSVVLFGAFGLILVMLLINSGAATPVPTPAATAPVVAAVPTQGVETEAAAPSEAPAGPSFDMQKVAAGQSLWQSTCFACHGMDLKGIPGLGKNLLESTFVHGLNDQQLHDFIVVGRPATDPTNTTGIAMPARGGNPSVTDEQIADVVIFIRYQTAKANGTLSSAPAAPAAPTQPPAPADASATESDSGGLPIDSILKPAGSDAATPTEDAGGLPIDAILNPAGAQTEAAPAEASVTPTEEPFSLPIDSILTPSGG